jgi:hexosaminidase
MDATGARSNQEDMHMFSNHRSFAWTNFARRMVLGAVMFALSSIGRADAVPTPSLMPLPAEWSCFPGRLPVAAGFTVAVTGHDDARLKAAVDGLLKRWEERTGLVLARGPAATATLLIECGGPAPEIPQLGEDESYLLAVDASRARLRAATVTGVLRGLATLQQLLQGGAEGWQLPVIQIRDRPRFAWRGLLVDVSRHWMPIEVILRELDGMALVKLNVLHLHLTDDQGFRVESRRFPRLQESGSDGHYYTQDQIRAIVAYAAARGIRVVPEFDMPGHATSWLVGYPDLAAAPGPYEIERHWGVFDPVMDPTNEALYPLLDGFLGEMAGLFPDAYMHIGGDEVNGKQWNSNVRIQQFIREHGLKDNAGLHAWFNRRVLAIVAKHGRKAIGWDEILDPSLPTDAMIQSWRGPESLAQAARLGHAGILSNGYYIDLSQPAADHYRVDPLPANTPVASADQSRVLGGEGTMWAEWVTPETIDSRIWPRMAAIAERLWSPQSVTDVDDMYRRLAIVSGRLEEAGLQHESNLDPMLHRFAGGSATPNELGALRTFIGLVEPVKGYHRGEYQPDITQASLLDGLADCARPDSSVARNFSRSVDHFLFDAGERNPAVAAELARQLAVWRTTAHDLVRNLAPHSPRVQEIVPLLQGLDETCRVGEEALHAIADCQPCPDDWRREKLAALARAGQPQAAVEIMAVAPLRRLVCAAAAEAQRATLTPEAWRTVVEHAAAAASDAGS